MDPEGSSRGERLNLYAELFHCLLRTNCETSLDQCLSDVTCAGLQFSLFLRMASRFREVGSKYLVHVEETSIACCLEDLFKIRCWLL